ncbi:hypothetical protein IOD16_02125 [Saccharothrix sp. 6-C]|uniref:Uncharacterized protein n=1 Tax=Saccharothrix texasensis TaxID=103734 RepID=A0A3N1H6V1_9PSEU|nr:MULTISPECIES: hypothetical protein [Saccharothrix]QQQ77368.1 hypothetical protein IOD16_02125 [Saccharothrix sp. 6-C]ROP38250.1 hypothetical protein EDD40_3598 [Saccharothrix texasensis]
MSDDVAIPAQVLSTNIFDSAAEAIEAIGAADVLGLGVRVSNRLVQDEESDDTLVEEWIVELLTTVPTVDEE